MPVIESAIVANVFETETSNVYELAPDTADHRNVGIKLNPTAVSPGLNKLGAFTYCVNENGMIRVLTIVSEVPVTVILYTPVGSEDVLSKVTITLSYGLIVVLLKLTVVPGGLPEADKLIGCENE